jgi:hypothetical protein
VCVCIYMYIYTHLKGAALGVSDFDFVRPINYLILIICQCNLASLQEHPISLVL